VTQNGGRSLVDATLATVRELALALPENFARQFEALARDIGLAEYTQAVLPPFSLARAWRLFLDQDQFTTGDEEDGVCTICMIATLYKLIEHSDPPMRQAFVAERQNLTRSRTEMALRLGVRLFMRGRRTILFHSDPQASASLLRNAIRYLTIAGEDEARLNPNSRKMLYGMRGVAQIILSRDDPDEAALEMAISDLELSHSLGDKSSQNLSYRREALLRLAEIHTDKRILDRLEPHFAKREETRLFYADWGRYWQHRAAFAHQCGMDDGEDLAAGIAACDAGLRLGDDGTCPEGVLRNTRGFLEYLLYQLLHQTDADRAAELLDAAISDLEIAFAFGLGGASLSYCLFWRAAQKRIVDPEAALADFAEAQRYLSNAAPEIAATLCEKIDAGIADCLLRQAIATGDETSILATCQVLLAMGKSASFHYPNLAFGVRVLLSPTNSEASEAVRELSNRAVKQISEHANALPADDPIAAPLLSQCGAICRRLDGKRPSDASLELFRAALDRPFPPTAEMLAYAGETALQIAKRCSADGLADDATFLFEDAAQWLEAAIELCAAEDGQISDNFRIDVCHSKAGEAFLRLRDGALGKAAITDRAIKHFEAARALGNETPHLLGLLGDAYYRRGSSLWNEADLEKALELKQLAQQAGHESRENWSIVGRIHTRLFERRSRDLDLSSAIGAIIRAHLKSPAWPWPLFQLADLARLRGDDLAQAIGLLPRDLADHSLAAYVATANREKLLQMGCRLAIESLEFHRKNLGGRTKVFTLDDPHRLLSATMVLKPTTSSNANAEIGRARRFSRYLRDRGLQSRFLLPTPIDVVATGEHDVIYVMERAPGVQLGRVLVGPGKRGYDHDGSGLTAAVDYLATYHDWCGRQPESITSAREFVACEFVETLIKLGSPREEAEAAATELIALIPPDLPAFAKKDAHPENWLVAPNGKIVMIDLESSRPLPALFELVQLIDDYPALAFDRTGWEKRHELAARYWKSCVGDPLDHEEAARVYHAFLAVRAAMGYCRWRKGSARTGSSSALQLLHLRADHHSAAARFLIESQPINRTRHLGPALVGGIL
jgi:hypothetical protein